MNKEAEVVKKDLVTMIVIIAMICIAMVAIYYYDQQSGILGRIGSTLFDKFTNR